jgi:adenosylhomocysteine nucleosidase
VHLVKCRVQSSEHISREKTIEQTTIGQTVTPGIVAALPSEAACLPDGVLFAVSGIGRASAASAAVSLLDQGATSLISWGLAGALSPRLAAGDLLLPRGVMSASGEMLHTDEPWRLQLAESLAGLAWHEGGIVESRDIVHSRMEKQELAGNSGAVAVDMESAAIAHVAQQAGVPFLVIRCIADTANEVPPAFLTAAIGPGGRIRMGKLLPAVLSHPGAWLSLARLGWHTRAALSTLQRVSQATNGLRALKQAGNQP